MPSRQQVERTLVRLGKSAPAGLRSRLGRASRRFRSSFRGPLVTVVVAVSDTETSRIGPCLESLGAQTYRNLDIALAPYAGARRALGNAREHLDADWRMRVLDEQRDLAAAWNHAAAQSRAAYVMFVRGGDDLLPGAVTRLVETLEGSGSDLAVGRDGELPPQVRALAEPPLDAAHRVEVHGATLADQPVAVTNLGIGNRLFRRTFWDSSGLQFTPEAPIGPRVALMSYVRARAFDLVTDEVHLPIGRREGFSVGAVRHHFAGLDEWLERHESLRRAVDALDLPAAADWWLWGVLDSAIQPLIGDVERATDDQWARLRDEVNRLLGSASETAWRSLRAESRVMLWLLAHDRREQLEEYVVARLFTQGRQPTQVHDGVVVADLPFRDDPAVGVPTDAYVLGEAETPLRATVHAISWPSPGRLELGLFARIEHVDLADSEPVVRAWLVEERTGARVDLDVEAAPDVRANLVAPSPYQDHSAGAVRVVVDTEALAAATSDGEPCSWRLVVEMSVHGLTRAGGVTEIDDRASAGFIETGHLGDREVAGARVGLRGRSAGVFRVVARPWAGPRLVEATVSGGRVRGTITAPGGVRRVRLVGPGGSVRARSSVDGDRTTFEVELPPKHPDDSPRRLDLIAASEAGDLEVGWPADAPQFLGGDDGYVVLTRTPTGHAGVTDAAATLVVDTIAHRGDAVEMRGRWLGTPPSAPRFTLVRGAMVVDGVEGREGDDVVVRFSTTWDPWALGEVAIPTGNYEIALHHGGGHLGRVQLSAELIDRLFDFEVDERYRFRVARRGREAALVLLPPLADDERGPYAQERLHDWFDTCDLPVDRQVAYLQSYAGASATDSQLAIHEELRRTRPDITVHWGVADRSSMVPEGGVPVILHSREWYRVMATAAYVSMNIDPDRWYLPRPGQRFLQTFHGYPSKSMGIRMWEAKGYTPRRVDRELERTSRDWSLILTPAPEMDEHYRREYRYDGPIHSAGYPRDDLLLSPDAGRVREETRARLGISADQKVVLYAPTWRDDLATNWRRAELTRHLDLEAASRQLGPDYVLLMRGHRFHARAEGRGQGARLIDVTDYPEINHLILAADAAVLDYSSLRFDFALTGRPMVFLVPDLATYTGGVRGFLYPFEESAPGPLLDTADQVVARLRDLDALRAECAEPLAAFNRRFNYLQDGHAAERVVAALLA